MQVDDVIGAYIQLRDRKEAVEKKHKEELAPIREGLDKLAAWLQRALVAQRLQNFKGTSGVAFLQTSTSVRMQDFDAFMAWVREHSAWEFLEKRASKSVVQDFVQDRGQVPPGLDIQQEIEVRIRRS